MKTPIEGLFQNVGQALTGCLRLSNEWRDTIYYTAVAGVGVADYALNGHVSLGFPTVLTCAREVIRDFAWRSYPITTRRVAGYNSSHPNFMRNALAAKFVWSSLFTGTTPYLTQLCWDIYHSPEGVENLSPLKYALGVTLPAIILHVTAAPVLSYLEVGGLKNIFKAYKEMWDWPRKDGGGGQTQTQKIKGGFLTFAKLAGRRFSPAPLRRDPTSLLGSSASLYQ